MMRRLPSPFALLALLALAAPLAAQKIVLLPEGSWVNDITPDGEVVVGTWEFGDGFVWRWRDEPAPTPIVGGDVVGVSDDGSVVCGTITGTTGQGTAALWTAAGGWQELGGLPGGGCGSLTTAYDISGDGTTVVGLGWEGCSGRGFRWTAATGMQMLENLVNGNNRASAISGDGSVMGGFAQGSFNRTPAFWAPDASGFVLDPDFVGEVFGFDEDGSRAVGTVVQDTSGIPKAFVRDMQTGALTDLGSLFPSWEGHATDISEDGQVIVGFDVLGLARKAWVWRPADGIVSLNARLTALGVPGAPELLVCRAVSDDGNVVVGGGESGGGGPFGFAGFIFEFESEWPQWTDLGGGLAGIDGIPLLVGTGPLTPQSAASLTLTGGKPSAPAAFVVGLSAANLPFKQGVLVPFPDLVVPTPLAPSGSVGWPFHWPAGLPSGFSIWWQVLVADAAGPAGFALSNALQATTP